MNKQNYQIIKSILAIVLCVAFLWTGKKFIWNQEPAEEPGLSPDYPPIAEITVTSTTTSTSLTSTTTTFADTTTSGTGTETGTETDFDTTTTSTVTSTTTTASATSTTVTEPGGTVTIPQTDGMTDAPEGYFDDALFIGDSRMVGLALYARFPNATYFASTGLDTYKIDKATSEVEGTKGQKFANVLAAKDYGKVYIMLGINELGYDRNTTKQNFMNLVSRIKTACPDAIIYIHGNLHVSHKRADRDSIVNNVQINEYNSFLASLADHVTTFYLDANPLFDAEDGYMRSDYTNDGVHPFAKHYAAWKEYLMTHVIVR
ncbi:MAG: hypothetical protein IJ060_10325 [Oscillospiraceae bacterium]|nr:hypothetical protein [Oscillospiraceae bacterium]